MTENPLHSTAARQRAAEINAEKHDLDALIARAKIADPKRAEKVRARLAEMPVTHRMRYVRAVRGKSLAAGIGAFCSECVGWERESVTRCTSLDCPLYPYRPYQSA